MKKRWRAFDANAPAARDIPVHPLRIHPITQLPFKSREIEAQGLCITAEIVFAQRILIFKHQIVHSPKLTLGVGRFGRFGGLLSQGMFMSQWEMAKDEPQTISESGLEPFDERIRAPAVGTFEIAVGQDRDGCRIGSCDMVIVTDDKSLFCMD